MNRATVDYINLNPTNHGDEILANELYSKLTHMRSGVTVNSKSSSS